MLASNVLCFKIFLLYSVACPEPAGLLIIIAAYPPLIISNALLTKTMPFPFAE